MPRSAGDAIRRFDPCGHIKHMDGGIGGRDQVAEWGHRFVTQSNNGLGRIAPNRLELLQGDNNDLWIKAATVLANMRPGQAKDAILVLLKALKNRKEDKDFRRQATLALSQIVAANR